MTLRAHHEASRDPAAGDVERRIRLLSYLGALLFLVLAVWLYAIAQDHPWRDGTILLLRTYAALMLSFLGGVRWGIAVGAGRAARGELALDAVPALLGWIALVVPIPYAFGLLAVAFAAQGAWDALSSHAGSIPGWFASLRVRLTMAATAAMVLALVATA